MLSWVFTAPGIMLGLLLVGLGTRVGATVKAARELRDAGAKVPRHVLQQFALSVALLALVPCWFTWVRLASKAEGWSHHAAVAVVQWAVANPLGFLLYLAFLPYAGYQSVLAVPEDSQAFWRDPLWLSIPWPLRLLAMACAMAMMALFIAAPQMPDGLVAPCMYGAAGSGALFLLTAGLSALCVSRRGRGDQPAEDKHSTGRGGN